MWGEAEGSEARETIARLQAGTLLVWDTGSLRNGIAMVVARDGTKMFVVFDARRPGVHEYDVSTSGYHDGYGDRTHFNPSACAPLVLPDGTVVAVKTAPASGSI